VSFYLVVTKLIFIFAVNLKTLKMSETKNSYLILIEILVTQISELRQKTNTEKEINKRLDLLILFLYNLKEDVVNTNFKLSEQEKLDAIASECHKTLGTRMNQSKYKIQSDEVDNLKKITSEFNEISKKLRSKCLKVQVTQMPNGDIRTGIYKKL